jgi:hypothetical protein
VVAVFSYVVLHVPIKHVVLKLIFLIESCGESPPAIELTIKMD